MLFRAFISLLAVTVLAPVSVVAQTLDHAAQRELVSRLEAALQQNYVFPDRIPAISAELDRRVQAGPVEADAFADSLGQGLLQASDDLHFAVIFDPEAVAADRRARAEGDTGAARQRARGQFRLS